MRLFREFKAGSDSLTKNIDDDIQRSEVTRKKTLDHVEKLSTRKIG